MFNGSWKSRLLGVLAALVAIVSGLMAVLDDNPATIIDTEEIIAAFAAVSLWMQREEKVSSEAAGAKKDWKMPRGSA